MPLCQFCGGNYQRLPTHYTMSDCRPQYNAYIARLTTAIVLIDIPPAYKLGQIGEDRPEYEYHNNEEELNSSEEEDGNIARVAQVEQIDGEYHEDDTAATPFFLKLDELDAAAELGTVMDTIHPFKTLSDYNLALLCRGPTAHRMANSQVTALLKMLKNGDINPSELTLKNGEEMDQSLKQIGADFMPFLKKSISIEGLSTTSVDFYYRDTALLIKSLLKRPDLSPHIHFRSVESFDGQGSRLYSEAWTGRRWSWLQSRIPAGEAILGVILSADETNLSVFSGNSKAHPVYITLANILADVRNKTSMRAVLTAGLIPSIPVTEAEKTSLVYKVAATKLIADCLNLLVAPLVEWSQYGGTFEGPDTLDGNHYEGRPFLWAAALDHPEACKWANLKSNVCLDCTTKPDNFDDLECANTQRDIKLAYSKFRIAAESVADGRAARAYRIVANLDTPSKMIVMPPFINWKHANLYQAASVPDLLHFLVKGILGDHVLQTFIPAIFDRIPAKTVRSKVKDQFARVYASIPPFAALKLFPKSYFKIGQLDGKDIKNLAKTILPVLQIALTEDVVISGWSRLSFIKCTRLCMEIYYLLSAPVLSDELLQILDEKIVELNTARAAFALLSPSNLKFIKWHKLHHVVDQIRLYGMPRNYSTELFEKLHSVRLKCVYRTSNKKDTLATLARAESVQDAVLDSVLKLQGAGFGSEIFTTISSSTTASIPHKDTRMAKEVLKERNYLKSQYAGSFTLAKVSAITSLTLAVIERAVRLYLLLEYTTTAVPPSRMIETFNLPSLDSERVQVFKSIKLIYCDVQLRGVFHKEFCRCTPTWHNGKARNDFALIVEDATKIGCKRYRIGKLLSLFKVKFLDRWRDLCLLEKYSIISKKRDVNSSLFRVEKIMENHQPGVEVLDIKYIYRSCHVITGFAATPTVDSDSDSATDGSSNTSSSSSSDHEDENVAPMYLNHFVDLQSFLEFFE